MNEKTESKEPNKVIHVSRSLEPERQEISPELALKHQRSVEKYPDIDLSESEYVVKIARRHPIGLFAPLLMSIMIFALAVLPLLATKNVNDFFTQTLNFEVPTSVFALVSLMLIASSIAVAFVSFYVFKNNKLYLTNESVIQRVQISLFSKQEQSVSLGSIEDSSYKKSNILQTIFNYGDVRLSTVGDETTYRLSFVSNPKEYMSTLDHAVEAFKNGRPITDSDN